MRLLDLEADIFDLRESVVHVGMPATEEAVRVGGFQGPGRIDFSDPLDPGETSAAGRPWSGGEIVTAVSGDGGGISIAHRQ